MSTKTYRAQVDGWIFDVTTEGGSIRIESLMPEQPTILFETTGPQGGDSGHGGAARLQIIKENGTHTAVHSLGSEYCCFPGEEDLGRVIVNSYGDWELTGLTAGLALLGHFINKLGLVDIELIGKASAVDEVYRETHWEEFPQAVPPSFSPPSPWDTTP